MWAPHSYFTIVSLDMHLWWFLHRCSQNLSELPKLQCSSNWTHSVASDNAIYGESLTVMVSEPQWVLTVQLWCFTQMFLESHWVVTISQLWCFSGMYLQSHWVVTMQLWQIFHRFSWNHIVSSDNAIASLTDVIGTTASSNKGMRSHLAQYSASS